VRKTLVAGNWKLNGSKASITELLKGILSGMPNDVTPDTQVAVCVPYIYISYIRDILEKENAASMIQLGSEDISKYESGAYTGEISGLMLKDFSCEYSIVGHSERRTLFSETDLDIAKKFALSQKHGIKPILCVGELLEDRERGITEEVIGRQLDVVINLVGVESFVESVIAYEPVWAIGTGVTASSEQAQNVHKFIRNKIAQINQDVAEKVQIIYGGSVNATNANKLFAMPDVDGGLIGGASLEAKSFLAICRAGK